MPPLPGPAVSAVELLRRSVERGATLVATGPLTNLALLEEFHPGILGHADLVIMGGYVGPPRAGFPPWGPEIDFNVQVDVRAARAAELEPCPTI